MTVSATRLLSRGAALFAALLLVLAPGIPLARESGPWSETDLERLVAPIALYPDALLEQILAAAAHPLEVVQAARWAKNHPAPGAEEAVNAVADKSWDPSVKSLVAFPGVLERMDRDIEWTESLGNAYAEQPDEVMDAVQRLRRKAKDAGGLAGDDNVRVTEERQTIAIQPADPRVIYVPFYDPVVVYGPGWWPAPVPAYWAPWPASHLTVRVGVVRGATIWLPPQLLFGNFHWPHHRALVRPHPPRPPVHRPQPIVEHRHPAPNSPSQPRAWPPHPRPALPIAPAPQRVFAPRAEFRAHPMPPPAVSARATPPLRPFAPTPRAAPAPGAPHVQIRPAAAPANHGTAQRAPVGEQRREMRPGALRVTYAR